MAKEWECTVPISGHAYITVEADTEEEAIKKAIEEVTLSDVETWQAHRQMHMGNVCNYDQPWEAEATCVSCEDMKD